MPVSVNTDEYKSTIGLDDLYVAAVTQDDASGYVADTPEYFAPAAEASQKPTINTETQYADDAPFEVVSIEGETEIELTVTGIPAVMLAKITGKVFNAASGRVWEDPESVAPYHALSFRSLKSNGKYRYYQYLKGRFSMPEQEAATKTDKPDIKATKIIYTAIPSVYKFNLGSVTRPVKRVWGDEDTTNFSGATWYGQVQTPSVTTPAALALSSSVPTDGATGISVSANQTLTFNNALVNDAIYQVGLFRVSDGAVIASAITLDATKKIITINPNADLTAVTAYLITYAVTDIYGQHLTGAVNFTTA